MKEKVNHYKNSTYQLDVEPTPSVFKALDYASSFLNQSGITAARLEAQVISCICENLTSAIACSRSSLDERRTSYGKIPQEVAS